jgi:hypothetical protein
MSAEMILCLFVVIAVAFAIGFGIGEYCGAENFKKEVLNYLLKLSKKTEVNNEKI